MLVEEALHAGISKALGGGRLAEVSAAIEGTAIKAGFSVVHEFVGHGVGRNMHEDPPVPNFVEPGRSPRLRPGMTLALEPMVNMGGSKVEIADNGWTVVTADRTPSAHFEHTIVIQEGPAEILSRT